MGESASALIDRIVTRHHAWLREALPRIKALLSTARADAGGALSSSLDALERVLTPWAIELEHHLMTEESAVFPLIRALKTGAGDGPGVVRIVLRHIETEHESARRALENIRGITSDFTAPSGAPDSVRRLYAALGELDADLREHIRLESDVLFPAVAAK